jgi:MFS family permease
MGEERFRRDAVTQLTYAMLGLWGFLLYALGPALPELRRELDVSRAVVSLHATLIAIGGIAVGLFGDRVMTRLGRRRAFWLAAGTVAASAAALALGHTLALTLPAALAMGVAGALAVSLVQATLADHHGGFAAAAIVEANAIAVLLGAAAPLAIAVAILLGYDWRAVFLIAALVAVPVLAARYRSVVFPSAPELPLGDPANPGRTGCTGRRCSCSSRSSSASSSGARTSSRPSLAFPRRRRRPPPGRSCSAWRPAAR